MHGGMGMTDELDIGHYAKRLMMINTTFGDATYHRNRYMRLPTRPDRGAARQGCCRHRWCQWYRHGPVSSVS